MRLADVEVGQSLEHGLCGNLVMDQDFSGMSCQCVVRWVRDILVVDVLAIEDSSGDERDAEVGRLFAVISKTALAFKENP